MVYLWWFLLVHFGMQDDLLGCALATLGFLAWQPVRDALVRTARWVQSVLRDPGEALVAFDFLYLLTVDEAYRVRAMRASPGALRR